MKIKKDDNILVITGKDQSKTGVVSKVLPKDGKIVVTGINMTKQHLKPSRKNPRGGIVNIPAPIQASNVEVICPHCGKATRVGYKITKDQKERICKKCQGNLDVKEKNVKA